MCETLMGGIEGILHNEAPLAKSIWQLLVDQWATCDDKSLSSVTGCGAPWSRGSRRMRLFAEHVAGLMFCGTR